VIDSPYRRAFNPQALIDEFMGISVKHTILFLVVISSVFICLPYTRGGCGGSCAVSSGGSSYDFMADPSVNMDMSTFDEFYKDNLGDNQTTLHTKSLSKETLSNSNSSFNQTSNGNASQNNIVAPNVINSQGNTTSDNGIVKLGASGMQDKRLSTLAFTTFNNNMF
jgi:hypothetical protein